MKEDRIAKWMKILFSIEENHLEKELDERELSGFRDKALSEFRAAITSRNRKSLQLVYLTMKRAAVVLLIIGIPAIIYFISQNRTPDYQGMIDEITDQQFKEETSLVLSDGSAIAIESDKSVLSYDSSGNKIVINSEQTLALDGSSASSDEEISYNRLVVPYGKQSTLTLSDGSVVCLNSGSYLLYPQEFSRKKREIYLAGEAFFDVSREQSRPFIVMTDDIRIEVLGTTFNVNAYPENKDIETVLVEGSVSVSKADSRNPSRNDHVLIPGHLASYSRISDDISTEEVDVEFYVSWKDGYFLCRKITLENLVQKLSRFYNIQILVEDEMLKNNTFSGKLDNRESIYEVFEIINASKSINYKETEEGILIHQSE